MFINNFVLRNHSLKNLLSETDGVSIVDTYQIMTSIKSQLHSVIQLDLDLLLVAFDF